MSTISNLVPFSTHHIQPKFGPDVNSAHADPAFAKPVETTPNEPEGSGFAHKIFEYGRKFLESPKIIGGSFDLGPGAVFGFRVEGSLHTKKSPLVEQNPFRLASTTVLEKNNPLHSIVWTQTGGILELGLGINGTLPLGQFAGLQGGFIPSALMRYRCVKPHVLGFFQSQNSLLSQNTTSFPFCASNAKGVPAGSEFELYGQGRLRALGALAVNFGTPVNGFINAGIGASGFVNVADAQEIGINILSLDGENRVRVSVNQVSEDIAQAGAMAYAGVVASIGPSFPSIGQGLLQGGTSLLSTPIGDMMNGYFTSLGVQASTSERSRVTNIATFDLDLSKPAACKAYDQLMKLSCVDAEELSCVKGSGVRQLKRAEKEAESRDEFSANLLGDKLFLYQALTNEKKGQFTTPDGETIVFRQAHFRQHESGWFDPTKDVLWESVSLKKNKDPLAAAKTFFRFSFRKEGDLSAQEFEDYFGLADSLALKGREDIQHAHAAGKNDDVCKRIMCESQQVTQSTDLYFTPQGIRNMQGASKEEAMQAYLSAIGKIRDLHDLSFVKKEPAKASTIVATLNAYNAEVNAGWFLNFGHSRRLHDLQTQYKEMCGREIDPDAITYRNAAHFADRLAQLKTATNPRDLEAFFVDLGKSKGFRYKCVIGALSHLAGESETLVHQHELNGSGVVFKYSDGGKLEGPSDIVTALLSKTL